MQQDYPAIDFVTRILCPDEEGVAVHVPFDRWDASSSDRWFAELSRRLEELLGPMGAYALMARAISDAGRHWPLLRSDLLDQDGLHALSLYLTYPSVDGNSCSEAVAASLQTLVDSLELLLNSLLGRELTDALLPTPAHMATTPDLSEGG
jgi:hypothetical protein